MPGIGQLREKTVIDPLQCAPPWSWRSIVEAVAKLRIKLSWLVPVKSPEPHTVVQQDAAVSHIQSGHRKTVFLREAFPQS
jgi:hypothetical protein